MWVKLCACPILQTHLDLMETVRTKRVYQPVRPSTIRTALARARAVRTSKVYGGVKVRDRGETCSLNRARWVKFIVAWSTA